MALYDHTRTLKSQWGRRTLTWNDLFLARLAQFDRNEVFAQAVVVPNHVVLCSIDYELMQSFPSLGNARKKLRSKSTGAADCVSCFRQRL